MIAAIGLPLALLLGIVADLVSGGAGRALGRDRRWWGRLTDRWGEVRRLWGKGRASERASALEAVGTAGALLGSGIVGAAAIGAIPGNLPLVYLGLLGATAGGYLAASASAPEERPPGSRLRAALAEPAFVTALGAAFLRWGALDLEGAFGAQEILGPGIVVGPPAALAGLVVSTVVILIAGPLRGTPAPPDGPGGASLLAALSRWGAAGATGLLVASLVGGPVGPDVVVFAAAAVGSVVVLGVAEALAGSLRGRTGTLLLVALTVLAAAGAVLVSAS
jgi:hypothetical protein